MIKKLRYLCTLLLIAVVSGAWGETKSITFSELGLENGVQYTEPFTSGDVSVTFAGGGNDGKYYTTGLGIRTYGNGTITIAAKGKTITKIALTFSGSDYAPASSDVWTSDGNGTGTDGINASWEGSATKVVLTRPTGSGHWRLQKVEVTFGNPTCATPIFTPEEGTYTSAQTVSISCTTDGATIYYTIDGSNPTASSSVYTTPISVSTTTTIKAIAVKSGMDDSEVATATYTIVNIEHAGTEADPYTVADARAAIDAGIGTTDVYATGIVSEIPTAYNSSYGNITFNFVDEEGNSEYLQAYRCVGDEAANVQVGDIVVVKGNLTKYNSTYEFAQGCTLVSLTHPVGAVNTPEFSLSTGSYKGTLTITLTQEDNLPIFYTLDDSDPTTSETAVEYTGAITIAETTTVKAAAKSGNTWSNVVTHIYTIVPVYENIAAMKAAITATAAAEAVDMYVTLTNAVVTYINGSNYYIEDASAGILIYNSSDGVKNFLTKTGLKLNGDMKAAGYIYNGLYELTKNFDFTGVTAEEGADIPVTEVTIAQLNENLLQYESKRVKVVDATVSSALASRKATIKQNGSSIQIYEKKQGNLAETALATANSVVTVVGYPGINNSTNQLNVWDAEDVTSTETPVVVPTPTFSPAAGEVEAGTKVKIVCPAEADGVEYSFDNTTWDEYTDPIEITEDITIYARAYDEDGNFSDVVSAAYTIKTVTPVVEGKSFVKVTSASDFSDGYYLLVYEKNEDSGNAFDGSLTTLDAANNYIAVAVAEGTIVATDENKASVFTITGSNDGYTIKSASGLYIGQTSDANGLKAQETALYNAITFGEDGEANIVSGGAYLRYNSTSGQDRFRYFKSSTYTSQQPVYLYKLTDQEPVTPKINPNLSFDETEFNVEPNAEFDEPTLNNQYEVAVTYSTTDAEIAAVDEATGNVTIGAKEGTATITAKFEGDETYMADEASYKITVKAVVVPTVDKYELVTDATTLTSGDKILIAYVGEDGATVMGVQQKNNRAGVVATVNTDNTITPNSDAQVITLENGWYFNVGTGYLYASSSDANQLKTETEADDNAKATIGIAQNEETGEVETTITFQGENTRNVMRFNPNSGNPLFACYASTSTTGFLPQIYRKVLLGDVNGDKKVDVADVTALVNLLLNESVSHNPTDHPAANLDEDEDLDADDVRALVEKILSEE